MSVEELAKLNMSDEELEKVQTEIDNTNNVESQEDLDASQEKTECVEPEPAIAYTRLGYINCDLNDKESAQVCLSKLKKINKELFNDLNEYFIIYFK